VSFLYRFGFGCVAEIYRYGKWTSGIWYPFPQRVIPILSKTFSSLPSTKRSLGYGPSLSEEPLPGALFGIHPERHQTDNALLGLHADPLYTYGNASLEKRQDSPLTQKESQFSLGSFRCTASLEVFVRLSFQVKACNDPTFYLCPRTLMTSRNEQGQRIARLAYPVSTTTA
jgi:hypothetical protein